MSYEVLSDDDKRRIVAEIRRELPDPTARKRALEAEHFKATLLATMGYGEFPNDLIPDAEVAAVTAALVVLDAEAQKIPPPPPPPPPPDEVGDPTPVVTP